MEESMMTNFNNEKTDKNVEMEEPSETSTANNNVEMLQRLQAEFENYRKRVNKEKLEFSNIFKRELIYNLLPVLDDFEGMITNTSDQESNGTKNIYTKLLAILKDEGLEPIESVGQKFDPDFHEAVLTEKIDDQENETIIAELQKGYLFKSKLLRPAKVKVSKNDKEETT